MLFKLNLQNLGIYRDIYTQYTHCTTKNVVFSGLCHSNSEEHPRVLESTDFKED